MKHMKKLLALLLVMSTTVTLSACGTKADAKELYKTASAKTAEMKSMDMSTKMKMTLKSGDQEVLDMNMDVNAKMQNLDKPEELLMDMSTKTSAAGTDTEIKMYYSDGYYYMDGAGQKIKYKMDVAELTKQIESTTGSQNLDVEVFKEMTSKKDGDNTVINFVANPDKMTEYVNTMLASLKQSLGQEVEVKLNEVKGDITVNKDSYITGQNMVMSCTMSMGGESVDLTIDMNAVYNNPGQDVTVTLPDFTGYQETDLSAVQ